MITMLDYPLRRSLARQSLAIVRSVGRVHVAFETMRRTFILIQRRRPVYFVVM